MSTTRSTNNNKMKAFAIGFIGLCLAVVAAAYFFFANPKQNDGDAASLSPRLKQYDSPSTNSNSQQGSGIITRQSDSGSTNTPTRSSVADDTEKTSFEFDVGVIFNHLQEVRMDKAGQVIVDHRALQALEAALDNPDIVLSDADLEELTKLIEVGLPGEGGAATAKITRDFYSYLRAKEEFLALQTNNTSPDQQIAVYDELAEIRREIFGETVANQLFEKSDNDARYMIESFRVAADASASDTEKSERQAFLADKYFQTRPPVDDWSNRKDLFLQERQSIVDANIDDAIKQQQLATLVTRHFSERELAVMENYGFDLEDDAP